MERECAQCKHRVKIISDWCYKQLNAFTCDEERNCLLGVDYTHCGKEAKHFEQIPIRLIERINSGVN